jgi:hypothetical protein
LHGQRRVKNASERIRNALGAEALVT